MEPIPDDSFKFLHIWRQEKRPVYKLPVCCVCVQWNYLHWSGHPRWGVGCRGGESKPCTSSITFTDLLRVGEIGEGSSTFVQSEGHLRGGAIVVLESGTWLTFLRTTKPSRSGSLLLHTKNKIHIVFQKIPSCIWKKEKRKKRKT